FIGCSVVLMFSLDKRLKPGRRAVFARRCVPAYLDCDSKPHGLSACSMSLIEEAARLTGYTFRNEALLVEALAHASSVGHRLESNERMEFLGDAVLGFVVCEYLFLNYPELLEGE